MRPKSHDALLFVVLSRLLPEALGIPCKFIQYKKQNNGLIWTPSGIIEWGFTVTEQEKSMREYIGTSGLDVGLGDCCM
jgi:hypothetical protein